MCGPAASVQVGCSLRGSDAGKNSRHARQARHAGNCIPINPYRNNPRILKFPHLLGLLYRLGLKTRRGRAYLRKTLEANGFRRGELSGRGESFSWCAILCSHDNFQITIGTVETVLNAPSWPLSERLCRTKQQSVYSSSTIGSCVQPSFKFGLSTLLYAPTFPQVELGFLK